MTTHTHLRTLRWALLASLGLPTSCGGNTERTAQQGQTTSGGDAFGGSGPTVGDSVNVVTSAVTGGPANTIGMVSAASTGGLVGSGGASSVSVSTTGAPEIPRCTAVGERTVEGTPTGFISCEEGFEVRAYKATCPNLLPEKGMAGAVGVGSCSSDADCPGLDYCEHTPLLGPLCARGCVTDDDCPSGQICRCDTPIGKCSLASCELNSDCPTGSACASLADNTCGLVHMYSCLDSADECTTDADCTANQGCMFEGLVDGPRICYPMLDCGRPFVVNAERRVAALHRRNDWAEPLGLETAHLTAAERAQLATHWREVALMEHASIAAFARFTLQLLQLGAPCELVEEAQSALADETRHARLAFTLASSYGGSEVGPGPLVTSDALSDDSIENVLMTTVLEGCIGETIAALEARVASDACSDPVIKSILAQIANDEARHAALAWRFLAYCIEHDPELVQVARGCFEQACLQAEGDAPEAQPSSLARYGVLTDAERRQLRSEALTEVIAPCAKQLLVSAHQTASRQQAEPAPPSALRPNIRGATREPFPRV